MALRLDRPRAWVESATGREHATIDTEIVPPPPLPAVTTPVTGRDSSGPDRRAGAVSGSARRAREGRVHPQEQDAPRDRRRLARHHARHAVYRALGRNDAVETVGDVDGRVATGLTRPDVFNWFRHVTEQVEKRRIHTVVFCFGATTTTTHDRGCRRDLAGRFGGPKWVKEYRRRVGGMMDIVNRAGGFVVRLGLPVTDDAAQSRRWRSSTARARQPVRQVGKVAFVDMYEAFEGRRVRVVPEERRRGARAGARPRRRPPRAGRRRHRRDEVAREVRRWYDSSWRSQ